jgi:hypothetical protein
MCCKDETKINVSFSKENHSIHGFKANLKIAMYVGQKDKGER